MRYTSGIAVFSFLAAALAALSCAPGARAADLPREWADALRPPPDYAFEPEVRYLRRWRCDGFSVESYLQRNGPDTFQRVFLAVPDGGKGKVPAVAVPFYFPEAMLGFNPETGGKECKYAGNGRDLSHYSEVEYMADLARRGYIVVSADAYHLTYARDGAPENMWAKWKHAGERLAKDHPGWTGIGKLTADTRLLVDMLAADPRVDRSRIGILGHSLGGKMAFYAGCLDPRVKVIVASDFGIVWDRTNWDAVWYWGKERVAAMEAAGRTHADLLEYAGGKPFCLIAGKYDDASSGALARGAYAGREGSFLLVDHATGHRPPRWATEKGYGFLDRFLKKAEK